MNPVSGAAARRSVNYGSLAADIPFCNWENNLSFALAFFVFSTHFAFLLGQIAFSGPCKHLAEKMPESLTKISYPFSGGDSRIIHPERVPATSDSVCCHFPLSEGGRAPATGQNHGIPCALRYNGGSGTGFRLSFYFTGIFSASGALRYLRRLKPEGAPMGRFQGEINDF